MQFLTSGTSDVSPEKEITFNLELASKTNKAGKYPIYLRITQNRKLMRLKTSIELERKSDWNPKKKEIRPSEPNAAKWNAILAKMDKHAEALSHSNETNRAKANSNPNNKRAVAMLRVLVEKGLTLQQMADTLNDEGFTTSRGCKFRPSTVYALIKRYQLNRKATKP